MEQGPLFNALMQRNGAAEAAPLPVTPPNSPAKVPPAGKRFINAQLIQQAYANNWNPNPVLLRAALGK